MKVKLRLPLADFDQLYVIVERSRRQKHVRASREALAVLLSDHSRLISTCKDAGIEIMDPPEQFRVDRSAPQKLASRRSA